MQLYLEIYNIIELPAIHTCAKQRKNNPCWDCRERFHLM